MLYMMIRQNVGLADDCSVVLVGPRPAEAFRGMKAEFCIAMWDGNNEDLPAEDLKILRACWVGAEIGGKGSRRMFRLSELLLGSVGPRGWVWTSFRHES